MPKDKRLLTGNQIKTMLTMALTQRYSHRQIALMLNVSKSTVDRILTRMLTPESYEHHVAQTTNALLDRSDEDVQLECYPNLKPGAAATPGSLSPRHGCLVPDFTTLARDFLNKNKNQTIRDVY